MAEHWSLEEVEAIVADYFQMLTAELTGRPYSKSEHYRRLQATVIRSEKSIEFKHRNISAVLNNFNQPSIRTLRPLQHYQGLLQQVVLQWVGDHHELLADLAEAAVLNPVTPPAPPFGEISDFVVDPPEVEVDPDQEPADAMQRPPFAGIDFARRDAVNRQLGQWGEEWVLEFERRRLHDVCSRPDLARRVSWASRVIGDGLGYDILSFNQDESERLIEVKTTGASRYFPFLVSSNEVVASERNPDKFQLYRVFDFSTTPKLYILSGALTSTCQLQVTQYRARAAGGPL